MDEYIKRSDVEEAYYKQRFSNEYLSFKDILRTIPSTDVQEIIRCQDCIGQSTWFKDAENGCNVCGMSGMYPKGTFDFCSYGERRKT